MYSEMFGRDDTGACTIKAIHFTISAHAGRGSVVAYDRGSRPQQRYCARFKTSTPSSPTLVKELLYG